MLYVEQPHTIAAEKRSEDLGTLDSDDISHVGSFPARDVVPFSFTSRLCKKTRVAQSLMGITTGIDCWISFNSEILFK